MTRTWLSPVDARRTAYMVDLDGVNLTNVRAFRLAGRGFALDFTGHREGTPQSLALNVDREGLAAFHDAVKALLAEED